MGDRYVGFQEADALKGRFGTSWNGTHEKVLALDVPNKPVSRIETRMIAPGPVAGVGMNGLDMSVEVFFRLKSLLALRA
jgi:hypothetical protein